MGRFEDIIECWGDYEFIEIHGARFQEDSDIVIVDDEDLEWYSVYLVHKDGCSLCIGDHATFSEALGHAVEVKLEHTHLAVGAKTLIDIKD